MKSMGEVIGTGNPEAGDYISAIPDSDSWGFNSVRARAVMGRLKQNGADEWASEKIEGFIGELQRNGNPDPKSERGRLLAAYQLLLLTRRDALQE